MRPHTTYHYSRVINQLRPPAIGTVGNHPYSKSISNSPSRIFVISTTSREVSTILQYSLQTQHHRNLSESAGGNMSVGYCFMNPQKILVASCRVVITKIFTAAA
ncbi:hypothetical protein Ac2012v2_001225 [Leucoagaricus gongylophorus]